MVKIWRIAAAYLFEDAPCSLTDCKESVLSAAGEAQPAHRPIEVCQTQVVAETLQEILQEILQWYRQCRRASR